jgi:hypothetical protein
VNEIAVTYHGPAGAYHSADEVGTWHEFARGATVTVSEDFAEQLLEIEDHKFELADEIEVTADQDGQADEALTTDQDDPEGVNATATYLEE